ncbi:uncharacterized protein SPPG_07864 [Spizellomyces punctatus DAOM BR117]|uniref:NADH dehydrogenase [ubiquinone] 1 alpha subcomplex subunit 7 n=1 Tax=Spizellomyces punctatus (strain DAOM BR117) TaxID=645134 RepID=A0A0L0H706_SPIPD|nr:uncharacterized protein SPPG_07864 [Spizellomyces punctatus DAOM BR117]KNC96651.1 hypothetical protein SPPG_07864 [Spizellomyces punctatus DAOM BR117]|eukprot:XP_016604691.1 hypothetical protein SPPG_07864 [Spizellomyces punctatus DAOM BR117]
MGFLEKFMARHFGGIPKSFRDLEWIIRVRPDLPPIMCKADEYRTTSPGSQPTYNPATEEKISKNYYFTRDTRRQYPQTVVYKAEEFQGLLPGGVEAKSLPLDTTTPHAVKGTPASSEAAYTPQNLPPIINKKYHWKPSMPHLKPNEVNPQLCIRGAT